MARISNKEYMNRCMSEIVETIKNSKRTVQFSMHYEDPNKEFLCVSIKDDAGNFRTYDIYYFWSRTTNKAVMNQILEALK